MHIFICYGSFNEISDHHFILDMAKQNTHKTPGHRAKKLSLQGRKKSDKLKLKVSLEYHGGLGTPNLLE